VRGTMKMVGQKIRALRDHQRYDVIDVLEQHAIGFHTDMHGGRPQPAEYMGPLDWLEGQAEFERREQRGIDEIADMFGVIPVCYGQPGSNWSPHVFPILRKWHIPTYCSGFGYIGCHAQPFYLGGMVNMSHLWGQDRQGREVRHAFGLNFELGTPGAFEEHQRQFRESYNLLEHGGMMSIMNHPCTLVKEDWFTTDLKPRELRDAGYEGFDKFIEFSLQHETKTITADQLPLLYPDRAMHRVFSREDLLALARTVGEEVYFQEMNGMALSAGELFGMFVEFLTRSDLEVQPTRTGPAAWTSSSARELERVGWTSKSDPEGAYCEYYDGPALSAGETDRDFTASLEDFTASLAGVKTFLRLNRRLPEAVGVAGKRVSPEDYFAALAKLVAGAADGQSLPEQIRITSAHNRLRDHVDVSAWEAACESVMMKRGFTAPKLLEHAYLQAWTLKPAILSGSV
ncbi:MAG: hypothetical protein ACM3VW_08340, partial [Bacteroidota bacterium]